MGNSYHEDLEAAGHVLKRNSYDDDVDIFVLDADIHNGPGCVKCGQSWCHHCRSKPTRCQVQDKIMELEQKCLIVTEVEFTDNLDHYLVWYKTNGVRTTAKVAKHKGETIAS